MSFATLSKKLVPTLSILVLAAGFAGCEGESGPEFDTIAVSGRFLALGDFCPTADKCAFVLEMNLQRRWDTDESYSDFGQLAETLEVGTDFTFDGLFDYNCDTLDYGASGFFSQNQHRTTISFKAFAYNLDTGAQLELAADTFSMGQPYPENEYDTCDTLEFSNMMFRPIASEEPAAEEAVTN